MPIRLQALIKTFPMVWVVIKSLVHEKSLVANNSFIFDAAPPFGRRMWSVLGSCTLPNYARVQSFFLGLCTCAISLHQI